MRALSKRQTYRLIATIVAGLILVLVSYQTDWLNEGAKKAEQNQPGLYNVEEVSDGDTIIVNMNGSREIVRMIGVDTPETHHPDRPVECFGREASEFTRKLAEGKVVRLQADPINTNRDRYDRLLRYVYLADGVLIETRIIAEGYGFSYTAFPFEKTAEFNSLEEQARSAKKGLWGACQVTADENGIERTNPAP